MAITWFTPFHSLLSGHHLVHAFSLSTEWPSPGSHLSTLYWVAITWFTPFHSLLSGQHLVHAFSLSTEWPTPGSHLFTLYFHSLEPKQRVHHRHNPHPHEIKFLVLLWTNCSTKFVGQTLTQSMKVNELTPFHIRTLSLTQSHNAVKTCNKYHDCF